MKRVIILLLTILLIVVGFSGCGTDHPIFGDKTQIYYVSYAEDEEGNIFGTVYMHNLGNLSKLPVGRYDVIKVEIYYGAVRDIDPYEIRVAAVSGDYSQLSNFNSEVNQNPPEKLVEIMETFIEKYA
jgi:hypothetical protein